MDKNKDREILWQNPDDPDEVMYEGVMYGHDENGKLVELTEEEQKMVNLLVSKTLTDPNTKQIYSFNTRRKEAQKSDTANLKQDGEVVNLKQHRKTKNKTRKIKK